MKQILLEKMNENIQRLRDGFIEEVDEKLKQLMDDYIQELITVSSVNEIHMPEINQERSPKGQLKDREFVARNSLLTELFEIKHIQTIHHIFIAVLIVLFLNIVIYDYVSTGKLNIDFELIYWAFGRFNVVIAVWICMFLSTLILIYPGFNWWSKLRKHNSIHDYIWLALYIFYLAVFFILPVKQIINYELPPASSFVILTEQIRLVMKVHAFVRSNVPKVLEKIDSKDSKKEIKLCPDFSKFLYFLFAPTLVYKDNYPRSSVIRWQYVASNFAQVIGCIFYTNFICLRFLVPVFEKFGHEPMRPKNLVLCVFGSMLPSTLIFLCGFFAVLHSWFNAFAEMLRFADRMFYLDWWNSRSFSEYFRTWNIVVHDWLYTYVYKDVAKCFPSNKLVSLYSVFTVSAIVHEFIVTFTFRNFYPIMYIMFGGFGVGFVFLTEKRKARTWNVFIWVMLFIGIGLLVSLYSMEWYARINCPPYDETYLDYIVPRSWVCYPLAVSHTGSSHVKDEL